MIIQVRGVSGSGKTTVVREVMSRVGGKWNPHYVKGRRKPLYYTNGNLVVLGHYESPCGGADTLGSPPKAFQFARQFDESSIVLYEGLLVSDDVNWISKAKDSKIIFLTTGIDKCLRRIERRRKRRRTKRALNKEKTIYRVSTLERTRRRLLDSGMYCVKRSQRQAIRLILKWIEERER